MEEKKKEDGFVNGEELLEAIKSIVREGNVRSIIIWSETGKKLLEIALTAGLLIGGATVVIAPFIAAIVAIAGVAKKVRIEVVRKN